MNRWWFAVTFAPEGGLAPMHGALFQDEYFQFSSQNMHPEARIFERADKTIILLGNPIIEARRDDDAVLACIGGNNWRQTLNGSYLVIIYDRATRKLELVNDRFASLALYYTKIGQNWHMASTPKYLYDQTGVNKSINETAAAEFLFLRRLLGEKTLLKNVSYLASASKMTIKPGGEFRSQKYWQPDYSQTPLPDKDLVPALADALSNAVKAHQSDQKKYGLLLSGGLDSRALLAAADQPFTCFTTCLQKNNESEVAGEVAEAASMPFHFIPRPPDLYDAVLDDAIFLSGSQQIYSENQFLSYGDRLDEQIQSMFIGLGLDIFFGGLYLPKEPARFLGRSLLHYRLQPLKTDMAANYIDNVSYRLKQSDPLLVVRSGRAKDIRGQLLASTNEILDNGRGIGASNYDSWEYMHLHNLSRHYSFPMMASVRTFTDCRAPALDNTLFDLALRMSASQKVNGTAYQYALALLAPELMKIRNANTNMPAGMSLPHQTRHKIIKYGAHKLFGTSYPVAPGRDERSWPSPKQSLESAPNIMKRVTSLKNSSRLADIPFIDMDGVRAALNEHEERRHDHSVLINLLLTLDGFFKPASEKVT